MPVKTGVMWSGGTFIVGIEDDAATGCLRMYVGTRGQGVYALVEDEDAKRDLSRAWAQAFSGHLMIAVPPASALYAESERP